MKRDNVNYLMVGLFVTVMMVTLMVVLYALSGRTGPVDKYLVYYPNVAGLKYGTPVFYEGYHVGQVEELQPENGPDGTRYRLQLSVLRGWRIPSDSIAHIRSSGLLARRVIEIEEGESSSQLSPGDLLQSQGEADVFAVVSRAANTFQEISTLAKPLIERLDTSVVQLSEELAILTREDLRPLIQKLEEQYTDPELFADLKRLMAKLNVSTDLVRDLLTQENRENLGEFLRNMNDMAINLNGLVSRIEFTRVQMGQVLEELDSLARDNREGVNESVVELRRTLGSISAHIETTMHHLEGSSRNVHEFTRQIRENPSLLLKGSAQPESEAVRQ